MIERELGVFKTWEENKIHCQTMILKFYNNKIIQMKPGLYNSFVALD